MMFVIVLSIVFPVCFIVILIGCLDCLMRKRKSENIRNRDTTDGRHNTEFTVDICSIPSSSDQVTIEPLPDILSKVSVALPQRPQITYAERGKLEVTVPDLSVQRSFPRDHLTYLNEIGSGWFGKVIESEAVQIVGGSYKSHVIVKMLKDDASKLEQKQFLDEVNAFRYLKDGNIMNLLGQCTETTPFLVILEYAAHGNLKSYLLENRQDMDEMYGKNKLVSFALDAASGLACLHKHDYIHNDLAARNCLVTSDYTLKIGDYGISDHLFKNEYYNTGSELLPIRWMAPETLNKVDDTWTTQSHDKSSDIWSFGILLWEISTSGERPYDMLTDEAVLQGVVLDRLVLPSDVDIKPPYKDRLWSIMVQCWQDPHGRLDVEQVFNSLEQLDRIRVDTMDAMSDFDQKWNQLQHNQTTDLGSRIALAGSFATDNSSSSSDKPSFLDGDSEVHDGVRSDDLIIDIGTDGTYTSGSHYNQPVPVISKQPGNNIIDHRTMVHHGDFTSSSQDHINVENEITRTSVSQNHMVPIKSPSQPVVTIHTPTLHNQSSTPSSLSSDHVNRTDTFTASNVQKETDTNSTPGSDVKGKSSQKLLDGTLHKPVKNSNGASMFDPPVSTEDEDFSDFVRTSPTAPSMDFTDFASADNGSFVKVGHLETIDVESTTDVNVANNSFSEFAIAAAEEKSNSDDDINTFSDFVTSAPSRVTESSNIITVEVETTVSNNTDTSLPQSLAGDEMPSRLDSDLLASNKSSPVPNLQSYNKNEVISTPIPDPDVHPEIQEGISDVNDGKENNIASVNISAENISVQKLEPDQNQNLISLEQISSEMPSLTSGSSGFSFLSDDLHLEKMSETSPNQSEQLVAVQDLQEHSSFQEPDIINVSTESNTVIIHTLDNSGTAVSSNDNFDQRLLSDSAQPTSQTALDHVGTAQNHKSQEHDNYDDKSSQEFDLVSGHLLYVNPGQETVIHDNSTPTESV